MFEAQPKVNKRHTFLWIFSSTGSGERRKGEQEGKLGEFHEHVVGHEVTGVEGKSAIMKALSPLFYRWGNWEEMARDLLPSYSWSMRIQSLSMSETVSCLSLPVSFSDSPPLLSTPEGFTHDFPAAQFTELVQLQVQKEGHTTTQKSKRRPERKPVTKAEGQTADRMSLPRSGLWWGRECCRRWSTPRAVPTHQLLFIQGQGEAATAAPGIIFSLKMHKLIAQSHAQKLEKRWGKFPTTLCIIVILLGLELTALNWDSLVLKW